WRRSMPPSSPTCSCNLARAATRAFRHACPYRHTALHGHHARDPRGRAEGEVANSRTFIEEGLSAGRGVLALLVGDRKAARYFNLGPAGLPGSLIAVLVVELVVSYGPVLLGLAGRSGGAGIGLL